MHDDIAQKKSLTYSFVKKRRHEKTDAMYGMMRETDINTNA